MTFYDDDPKNCEYCGKYIFAPATYFMYKGKPYCSTNCITNNLICEGLVYEEDLLSAEDKYNEYEDSHEDE